MSHAMVPTTPSVTPPYPTPSKVLCTPMPLGPSQKSHWVATSTTLSHTITTPTAALQSLSKILPTHPSSKVLIKYSAKRKTGDTNPNSMSRSIKCQWQSKPTLKHKTVHTNLLNPLTIESTQLKELFRPTRITSSVVYVLLMRTGPSNYGIN